MRLSEIEARDWRGLSASLTDLSPRLNLVLGPNEAGKSRLFQALQYAFFEGYRGNAQHKAALQTWDTSQAPFTRVAFEVNGVAYEIQKQYLKGPFAQLSGGGATLKGEDAETRLRELLGTRPGSTRGADVADQGIWPMLMVGQGHSRTPLNDHINEDGKSRLQSRLSDEIGVAAIGETGQRLLELAEREYGRYFTATGQTGKTLTAALARVEKAAAALTAAEAALLQQQAISTDLEGAQEELKTLSRRLNDANDRAAEAERKAQAATQLQGTIQLRTAELHSATTEERSAELALARRTEQAGALAELEAKHRAETEQLHVAQATATQLATDYDRAVQQYGAARDALVAAKDALAAAETHQRRSQIATTIEQRRKQLLDVTNAGRRVAAAAVALNKLPALTPAAIAKLRALHTAVLTARARVTGAAVAVSVTALRSIAIDGAMLASGQRVDIEVIENRSIAIGDVATIAIEPSRGELGALRDALQDAEDALSAALAPFGLPNLAAAESAFVARGDADAELRTARELSAAAGSSSEAELEAQITALSAELADLGVGLDAAPDVVGLTAAARAAEIEVEAAREAQQVARDAQVGGNARRDALVASVGGLAGQIATAKESLASAQSAEALEAAVASTRDARTSAQEALKRAQDAFAEAGGADIQSSAEQARQAADQMALRERTTRERCQRLQGELRITLANAPFETVQDAKAESDLAQAEYGRLMRQAAAAKLLRTTIVEERRKVVDQLTAPVIQRIRPYLSDLFPGSTLSTGENLEFTGLLSGNVAEPFADLSGGAQEQLSLLTRIGLAEVLAGGGTLPLVLDDALVNTDVERIARIQKALYRAAQGGLQVLLFSCHDVLFDSLGADRVITLATQRRRSAAP
ncbi:hypothetical protein E4T66_17485 [Sinimarinibacterium sp. CAU 1509]|uniref:AAA family ATPase n=1 Tax=Sinimarinibacterium sp. CAU 1509 TaxID=2562283 RepID=UPI0010ABC16B|nr:AAA family ATPase [Sinimarinibacterium sp. CAU 1509]TJY57202.1 hypothetical protein E4T66_17485 [Sinimarinibacterium sp. CAU 1509]